MSSKPMAGAEEADPQNLLFHHMPVRRLEAEVIRDEILAVAGDLHVASWADRQWKCISLNSWTAAASRRVARWTATAGEAFIFAFAAISFRR